MRTNHSNNLCLSFLAEILKDFDEGLLTGILIDLHKALDTTNHEIASKTQSHELGLIIWWQFMSFVPT